MREYKLALRTVGNQPVVIIPRRVLRALLEAGWREGDAVTISVIGPHMDFTNHSEAQRHKRWLGQVQGDA